MTKWKYVCFQRTIIRSARGAETVWQKPAVKRLSGKKGLSSWQCRRQIAWLALTTCWFVEMSQFNLARTVSRNTSFYFKLPLVFHHLRESDVGFKTTPIILEKAVRENQEDLPAALHARDNILNRCNADLGKSSHFLDLTNYSSHGKVEWCTYNLSKMSSIANHFVHLKVPFSSTDP